MHILKILDLLEKLESTISKLYAAFSRSFVDDPETSRFFDQMSIEESLHANLVKFQRRIVRPNIKDCKEIDFDAREVEKAIEEVVRAIKTSERLSLEAALKLSLDIENGMAEQHYRNTIQRSFPDIVKLMNSLTSFDCRHSDAFLLFAKKRGFDFDIKQSTFIPVCPITEDIKISPQPSDEENTSVSKELIERIEYLYEWQDKMDYYKVLGIRESASSNQIRLAFYKIAKEFHPDMHTDLTPKLLVKLNSVFSRMALAYSTLMNESSRLKYNESLPSRHH